MSANNGAPLVNAATAILSMRSSSFDELSAYGEVVDNSIQAEAKNVKMKLDTTGKLTFRLAMMALVWMLKLLVDFSRMVEPIQRPRGDWAVWRWNEAWSHSSV